MFRFFATILPALACTLAAGTFFVRGLTPDSRGEPMIVAGGEGNGIQTIDFQEPDCGDPARLAVQAIPASGGGTALFLTVNADGHIVAIDLTTDESDAI
jgi:hypothetical protein